MTDALRSLQISEEQRSLRRPRAARARWRVLWISLSALGAILAVVATMLAVSSRPTPVQVMTVAATEGSRRGGGILTAGGYVRHARVVNVVPRVSGVIATLRVAEGDVVSEGDVIATIESKELEEQVAEARADFRAAQARSAELEAGARPQELAEASARVDALRLAAERLERDWGRSKVLAEGGVVSAQSLDQIESELLVARKTYDASRHSLALLEAGPRREAVHAARAAVDAARARLQRATELLDRTQIRAPLGGRVLRKFLDVGAVVSFGLPYAEGVSTLAPGSPIVSIGQIEGLEAVADVNESDLGRISLQEPVEVRADAFPAETYHARVLRVSPRADRNKNTVEVTVRLDDPAPSGLAHDMSVKLSFLGGQPSAGPIAPLVPATAIVERGGAQLVYAVEDGHARLRPIATGAPLRSGLVPVRTGLAEGDVIVASGVQALKDGTRVVSVSTPMTGGERP